MPVREGLVVGMALLLPACGGSVDEKRAAATGAGGSAASSTASAPSASSVSSNAASSTGAGGGGPCVPGVDGCPLWVEVSSGTKELASGWCIAADGNGDVF